MSATLATTTIPPGGTAQLQFFLTSAEALTSGGAVITLDPAIFDNISAVDVFSATGDQIGAANINGRKVDVEFQSQTGGIGRIPSLPLITITVPVLASAKPGSASSPTFQPGSNAWTDTQGRQYSVVLASGSLTVSGSLSISGVTPVGRILPTGTVVTVAGTGFTASTTAAIDGVALSNIQLIGPQQLNLTLNTPTDLEFRRVSLQDGNALASFFPVLHGPMVNTRLAAPLTNIQPIFPLQLYPAATGGCFCVTGAREGILALQNPSDSSVDVTLFGYGIHDPLAQPRTVTLPPGASYQEVENNVDSSTTYILPTAPIRTVSVSYAPNYPGTPVGAGAATAFVVPPQQLSVVGGHGSPITWNVNLGGPPPAPIPLTVVSSFPANFTVSASTVSGGSWLSVSPSQGSACVDIEPNELSNDCPTPSAVTVSADSSQLLPGTYNGSLAFIPQGPDAQPAIIPVVLNVYAKPQILTDVSLPPLNAYPSPESFGIRLTSTAGPVNFTAAATTVSGQKWLSVSPTQGQTPATLQVTYTPSALTGLADTGAITIASPNNTITMNTSVAAPAPVVAVSFKPDSLQFTGFAGQAPPPVEVITIQEFPSPISLSVQTASGENWLSAKLNGSSASVTVNQTGLSAGTYQGAVTFSSPNAQSPFPIPVTLFVTADPPPPITVSPAALSLTAVHGSSLPAGSLRVNTGVLPLPFTVSFSPSGFPSWLYATTAPPPAGIEPSLPPGITPGIVEVDINAGALPPGTYNGAVTVTSPTGSSNSATVPITLTVTEAPPPLPPSGTVPLVTAVLNGASMSPGALAPDEIISIFGQNIGPLLPPGPPTASSIKVLFDNLPALLLYVSPTQINAIVPNEVTRSSTAISVQYNGATIPAGSYLVATSAPAVFTINSSGEGQAAVLNQDQTINSPANPAARGSIIQIYATGAGATALPVSVAIGGAAAAVTFAAETPGEVSGVLQVNAVVSQAVAPGSTIPIVLTVGSAQSQTTAVIAIK